jgi:hypothetical protein
MKVSLEQAIEIHARALVRKHRDKAPCNARSYAAAREDCGDHEGYGVWLGVAAEAERILKENGAEARLSDESAG